MIELTNGQDDLREFRISNSSAILSAFLDDFKPVANHYLTGSYVTGSISGIPTGSADKRNSASHMYSGLLSVSLLLLLVV
jgi:hypothetical protein